MATIEPRLIHLLNNNSQGHDLPPIQLLPFGTPASESLSLPPLESDPAQKIDKPVPPPPPPSTTTQIPPLHAVGIDMNRSTPADNAFANDAPSQLPSAGRPLHLLLGEQPEPSTSTLALRMFVEDSTSDAQDDPATKKRHRALTNKDDFVQLPQPLKKQKSTQQVMPPIIAGLHEPPPNAGVFPPISGGFDDTEALGLVAPIKDFNNAVDDRGVNAAATPLSDGDNKNNNAGSAKVKRRAAKPRRKWTDQETNALLLGVSRHGVGKWTSILEDPDFTFNDRTAGDLKDRFRTCCPDELRGASSTGLGGKKQRSSASESGTNDQATYNTATSAHAHEDGISSSSTHPPKAKGTLQLANILIEAETASTPPQPPPPSSDHEIFHQYSYPHSHPDSDSAPGKQQRKSRAHRKKMEDLEALGINGPFKKSRRRERRPFTEQDDKEILEGLEQYGPAWTKIQRDRKYNLSSRQPTDLRDRVRNKYPEIYARIEKGHYHVKEGKAVGLLEPMISANLERPMYMSAGGELHNKSSYEDMTRTVAERAKQGELSQSSSREEIGLAGRGVGLGVNPGAYITPSEMDISRLLLDDSTHSASAPRLASGPTAGPGTGDHQHSHHSFPQPQPVRYRAGPAGPGAGTGVPAYDNMAPDRRYGAGR